MKKVSLLVLLAILASTLLMAAIPTNIVRLTVINKSGYDVYMKLTGSAVTEAYYYLTVPAGDQDAPMVKVFTVMEDVYARETWQCNGVKSSGTLVVDGNLRLTFTPCGKRLSYCYDYFYNFTTWKCAGVDPQTGKPVFKPTDYTVARTFYHGQGEPRMEKVTYFKYLTAGQPYWIASYLYTGYWNFGCFTWYYRIRSWYTPRGCWFHYQY
jgi:hypothetical protein